MIGSLPVSSVALYMTRPWGGMPLAPYDVWIGAYAGDVQSADAVRCAGPLDVEPDYSGARTMIE